VTSSLSGPGEREAEIRARLDAATPGPWHRNGKAVLGPREERDLGTGPAALLHTGMPYDGPDGRCGANAELAAHAPDDLAYLLGELDDAQRLFDALGSEAAQELKAAHAALTKLREHNALLEGQLAKARERMTELATLQDRIPDDQNGDWGLGWDLGYNAAFGEVRAIAAEGLATGAELHHRQEIYLEWHEFPVQSSKRVICSECSGQLVPWDEVDEASLVLWPCPEAKDLGLGEGATDA